MEDEADEKPAAHWANRWYFFVPPVVVGLWILEVVAWGVVDLIAPGAEREVRLMGSGPTSGIGLLFEIGEWLGIVGWSSLFLCYFALLSRKRASAWWALGGLCVGLNLLLYVALLFRPPRWHARPPLAPLPTKPFGWKESARAGALLKDSFACESCDALLSYGVSECSACGERFRYEDGKPLAREEA